MSNFGSSSSGYQSYSHFSPSDINFFSQDELVTIVPSFVGGTDDRSSRYQQFLNGSYGPFEPLIPTKVPLWLAVQLKKNRKCNIQTPDWMDVYRLQSVLDQERAEEKFQDLPVHYLEVATELIEIAPDDIVNVQIVRALLEDLWATRASKVRKGLLAIQSGTQAIKLNGIAAMEINTVREFVAQALQEFYTLNKALNGQ